MSDNPLLSAALAYADMGFPVFPCKPDKSPHTKHGFKDATTDPEQITEWWTEWPDALIGIPTGEASGFIVIDVDDLENWEELTDEHGGEPETLQARTGREGGGWHLVFRYPGVHVRCTSSKLAEGVDVKGDGGYIIVPPSLHSSGAEYAWLDGNYEPIGFTDFDLGGFWNFVGDIPDWLLGLIQDSQDRGTALGDEERISEGTRHDALMSIAGTMRNYGMSAEEIEALLLIVNVNRCDPPLEEDEVHTIAEDAGGYAVGHAEAEPVIINMADIKPEKVEWIWEGRIPEGALTILAGLPGVAKSVLTCDIASHITTGIHWPDGSPCPIGSVLLMTSEDDPAKTVRPRLDAARADVAKVDLMTLKRGFDKSGKLAETMLTLNDIPEIMKAVDRMPTCKLIIIDPIGDYLGAKLDAHRENEVRAALRPLATLAQDRGIAVLLVAHPPKSATRAADAVLGSRAFTGVVRAVWHLMEDPDERGRRLFVPGKNNLAARSYGLAFHVVGVDGHPRIEWEDELLDITADDVFAITTEKGKPGPKPEIRDRARDWLIDLLGNDAFYVSNIKEAAITAGFNWRTVQRAADELNVVSWKQDGAGVWELPEEDED